MDKNIRNPDFKALLFPPPPPQHPTPTPLAYDDADVPPHRKGRIGERTTTEYGREERTESSPENGLIRLFLLLRVKGSKKVIMVIPDEEE